MQPSKSKDFVRSVLPNGNMWPFCGPLLPKPAHPSNCALIYPLDYSDLKYFLYSMLLLSFLF